MFIIALLLILFRYFSQYRSLIKKYSIVIDCGSSGSRLFIYEWLVESGPPKIDNLNFLKDGNDKVINFKVEPGISHFSKSPQDVVPYLLDLIGKAEFYLPSSEIKRTNINILATAGMRLLTIDEQNEIIKNITINLPKKMKFQLGRVEVISGENEGFYSWISVNGLMNILDSSSSSSYGIIEVGGASLQVAYELPKAKQQQANFVLRSYCHKTNKWYTRYVFSQTILGMGMNTALDHYFNIKTPETPVNETLEPCVPNGCFIKRNLKHSIQTVLRGTGNFMECLQNVDEIFSQLINLTLDEKKEKKKFTIPNIPLEGKFFGFSEIWYSFHDFLMMNSSHLNPQHYLSKIKKFCSKPCRSHIHHMTMGRYHSKDVKKLSYQCFRIAFLHFLFGVLFKHHDDFDIVPIFDINGQEVQWTYGAILQRYLQES